MLFINNHPHITIYNLFGFNSNHKLIKQIGVLNIKTAAKVKAELIRDGLSVEMCISRNYPLYR